MLDRVHTSPQPLSHGRFGFGWRIGASVVCKRTLGHRQSVRASDASTSCFIKSPTFSTLLSLDHSDLYIFSVRKVRRDIVFISFHFFSISTVVAFLSSSSLAIRVMELTQLLHELYKAYYFDVIYDYIRNISFDVPSKPVIALICVGKADISLPGSD